MKDTIEVPKIWFERLIKIAQNIEIENPNEYKEYNAFFHNHLPTLMGYIDSAKNFIK